MTILIVDDNKELAELLKRISIGKGHSACAIYDGEEALELIKANKYDLIFLDHNMPGLTGLELAKYIKQNNLKPKTVMITGYPEMGKSFAKSVGVDEYLTKPLKMKEVEDIIDKYSKQTGA